MDGRLPQIVRNAFSLLLTLVVMSGWLALHNHDACAGNGSLSPTLKLGNPANPTSLDIRIDSRWVAGDGYRPLRLQIKTVGNVPLPRDRQLTIELRPRERYSASARDRVFQETIELPAGTASLSKTIYLPENPNCNTCKARLWVGSYDPRRVLSYPIGLTNGNQLVIDTAPRILIVDSDAPSFEELGSRAESAYRSENLDKITDANGFIRSVRQMYLSQNNNTQSWEKNSAWHDVNALLPTCHIINPEDLPLNWIGMTSLDIACISLADLKQLRETERQWESLTRWTRCGGNLWVTGCGDQFSKHSEVATLLGLPESDLSNWQSADVKGYGEILEELNVDQYGNPLAEAKINSKKKKKKKPAPKRLNPIRFRNLQMGTVVLFPEEDALSIDDRLHWHWIFKSLGSERWMWMERNGLSGRRENRGFWKFMVPGVGLAPVKTFVTLLTMFVLGIGPVSFVVLRRWNRPNWLMFTVPIAAAIVTLGLVAYALLTDGISVRGRSRTITHIDQRSGMEATWSRQAYYAGLPPSDGLRFSDKTPVYPIDFAPYGEHMRDRKLDWTDNQQHLRSGFLGSRETSQFLVQRCRKTSAGLDIELEGQGADARLKVTNRLGTDIAELYVLNGDFQESFGCESLADGESATLGLLETNEVTAMLNGVCGNKCMAPPTGVAPDEIHSYGNFSRRSRYYNNQPINEPDNCVAERIVSPTSPFNTTAGKAGAKRYYAILREPQDIPVGISNVRWVRALHLIVGEW